MTICFTVPGKPVSYKRNNHNFGQHQSFLPKKYRDYRNQVAIIAKLAMRGQSYTVKPVSIIVTAFCSIKHDSRQAGDIDNILKSILDSLNGIFYKDDGQVIHAVIHKVKDKDNPRVEVIITDEF